MDSYEQTHPTKLNLGFRGCFRGARTDDKHAMVSDLCGDRSLTATIRIDERGSCLRHTAADESGRDFAPIKSFYSAGSTQLAQRDPTKSPATARWWVSPRRAYGARRCRGVQLSGGSFPRSVPYPAREPTPRLRVGGPQSPKSSINGDQNGPINDHPEPHPPTPQVGPRNLARESTSDIHGQAISGVEGGQAG